MKGRELGSKPRDHSGSTLRYQAIRGQGSLEKEGKRGARLCGRARDANSWDAEIDVSPKEKDRI